MAEERVRPCMECGTILPFDAEICSLCGERYRVGRISEEAVKPCLACDEVIPARHLFCPKCGDFTLAVTVPDGFVPQIGAREGALLLYGVRCLSVSTLVVTIALACEALFQIYLAYSPAR